MASPRIKLLTCLIALSLIVGCTPSFVTPTPIPPLDPNAIETFMVQTADVASTQTMLALPPSTSTATLTPTPRNTFTPEPSFTPVQPYIFPSPTPYQRVQYYRLKHDAQLAMFDFKSRTFDDNSEGQLRQTPEIVPLFLDPKLTSGTGRTNLSGAWETYLNALNDNDERKIRYVQGTRAGLFNTSGFPDMESLTMGGNIITLRTIREGWGQVNTMSYGSPPSAAEVNYVTRPDLVHKFVVVGWKRTTKTTVVVKPPPGDVFWPFVAKRALWVPMERLEAFPILPMDVTANKDLYMQKNPGPDVETTNLQLAKGETAKIVGYYPSSSDVWGRLPTGLWIPLLYKHQFLTTWTMETSSPP